MPVVRLCIIGILLYKIMTHDSFLRGLKYILCKNDISICANLYSMFSVRYVIRKNRNNEQSNNK